MQNELVFAGFPSDSTRPRTGYGTISLIAFLGAHVVLAALIQAFPVVATIHALIVYTIALWAVLRWNSADIVCVAAYAAGTDVLWRMTGAHVPWEISKYLVAAICLGGILRMGRRARWSALPIMYFLVLLPSAVIVARSWPGSFGDLIQPLSFNLSGPFALFATAWYASQLKLTQQSTRRLLINLIGPVLTIAVITLLSTYSGGDLYFTDQSNLATSGGFGPNQVSIVLSLGTLAAAILTMDPELPLWQRSVVLSLAALFGIQSAMTFSRGGLYSFAVAFIPAAFLFVRDRSTRKWLIYSTMLIGVLSVTLVLPRLENLTGGALATRFQNTDPTHRGEIIREDLRIWSENPIMGVGPGGARPQRRTETRSSHTEYTRLLSEHGLFGVVALLTLGAICFVQWSRPQSRRERAMRLAFLLWSLSAMFHVDMRIAAISFVFGIACTQTFMLPETANSRNRALPE